MSNKKLFIMGLSHKGRLDEEGPIFSVITDLSEISLIKLKNVINLIGSNQHITLYDKDDETESEYDEIFTDQDFKQIMEHISDDTYYMDETTDGRKFYPLIPTFMLINQPILIENIPDNQEEMRKFLCSSPKL